MLRIVPILRVIMEVFSTAWVVNMRPFMLVLFMVRMSDTRRSWNAEGAPRARPA